MVEALRGELGAAHAEARELQDQVAQLKDQLARYQDKNNVSLHPTAFLPSVFTI